MKSNEEISVDKHVGERLRHRRNVLNISLEDLARDSSVSWQQLQKYETGLTRLSAGRLYSLSKLLNVPITYFFEGANVSTIPAREKDNIVNFPEQSPELIELFHAYSKIKNPKLRKSVLELISNFDAQEKI